MRKATLTRLESSDEGTFGEIETDSGFTCLSAELPWRDNAKGKSCVPPGKYRCTWRSSPRLGRKCYWLEDVRGREAVQIHAANFAGDAAKGLRSELLGCIAPGLELATVCGQRALCSSREALRLLEDDLRREPFELTIRSKITPR